VRLALLLLAAAALLAACTSHSEETWIRPGIGRLPDAAETAAGE